MTPSAVRRSAARVPAPRHRAREFGRPCGIATAMRRAELAWRRELAAQTVADVMAGVPASAADRTRRWFASERTHGLMDFAATEAYLHRIDAARPASRDADALRSLHLSHLRTVPFENLSIHLGEEIVLAEQPLLDKLVGARRGGFCYELNGAFAALLRALGYEVELLAARVFGADGRRDPRTTTWRCAFRTPNGPWLADVGFGGTATIRCGWASAETSPIPEGSSVSRRHPRVILMSSGTASRSTASNNARAHLPTSRSAAGGIAPLPPPTSRSPWSARGSRRPVGSRSPAVRS